MENGNSPASPAKTENATGSNPKPAPVPASPSAATDGSGTPQTTLKLGLDARIDRAGVKAISEHTTEKGKRKIGRPRKTPLPVGPVDSGSLPPSIPAASQAETLAVEFESRPEAFDEATAEALVEGIIEALNDFAAAFQRNAAMRWTADAAVAEQAAQSARMSEKVRATVKAGGVACLRKYMVDLQYAPETTLAIGLGLWGVGNFIAYRKLEQTGKQLRQPSTN